MHTTRPTPDSLVPHNYFKENIRLFFQKPSNGDDPQPPEDIEDCGIHVGIDHTSRKELLVIGDILMDSTAFIYAEVSKTTFGGQVVCHGFAHLLKPEFVKLLENSETGIFNLKNIIIFYTFI